MLALLACPILFASAVSTSKPLDRLHDIAKTVVESAAIKPGETVPGYTNTTPYVLHIPGGNKGYPAFWVRDAAMMLGADFVSANDIEGWIQLIAKVQSPSSMVFLKNGLYVPAFSIPDHVTVTGNACWYPGAYDGEDQGNGTYGFVPPADDAFYYIQMFAEHYRLTKKTDFFLRFQTSATRAFDSVMVNGDGLVVCSPKPGHTRVDWGFCDSIRKTGACLMPSLLRWRAAKDLESLYSASKDGAKAREYRDIAKNLAVKIAATFTPSGTEPLLLFSSTGQGHQEDVWASAYAVWLGVLPKATAKRVSLRLLELYKKGETIFEGQARELPAGEFWEKAGGQGYYQNGAYWGTPTGWIVYTISKVDRASALLILDEFVASLEKYKDKGAPWECFNPSLNHYQNPLYCATVALPYVALKRRL